VSEPSEERGNGRRGRNRGKGGVRGRGRRNPASSASLLERSTRPPPPYRPSSKNTAPVIRFGPRHPYTEEVGPTQPLPESATALDFFMQMFDEHLMQHIVTQTNLFATIREGHHQQWKDLTVAEFKSFLGTVILMGIHSLPSYESYWSTDELLMLLNRFAEIDF